MVSCRLASIGSAAADMRRGGHAITVESAPANRRSDEDITTNDTSTPTLVSTSTTTLGPITRARARRLTHQVSSLLSSGSSYLDNGDTCTLILLRDNGLD
jgi:hypothetical protein